MKVITIKKVRELFNWEISNATASRKISLLRDALNKPKPQVISEKEFKEYYGMDIADSELVPNARTLRAIKEAEHPNKLKTYSTAKELFKDLEKGL